MASSSFALDGFDPLRNRELDEDSRQRRRPSHPPRRFARRSGPLTAAPSRMGSPSLLDDALSSEGGRPRQQRNLGSPAAFLELEHDPLARRCDPLVIAEHSDVRGRVESLPVTTTSGLLLTHRPTPAPRPRRPMEVARYSSAYGGGERGDGFRRLRTMARLWLAVAFGMLAITTAVLYHSYHHEKSSDSAAKAAADARSLALTKTEEESGARRKVVLRPFPKIQDAAETQEEEEPRLTRQLKAVKSNSHQHQNNQDHKQSHSKHSDQKHRHRHHLHPLDDLSHLRDEFESWITHHGKQYESHEEKESRFHIWTQNHLRTQEKNIKHGPCKMTNKHVFGSNAFQDLSPEEFKGKYLTGYHSPFADDLQKHHYSNATEAHPGIRQLTRGSGKVLEPDMTRPHMHESVRNRVLYKVEAEPRTAQSRNCEWYNVPCWLRWFFNTVGISFSSLTGTMEPAYDANTYPTSVDWRDSGAVTDVFSQGDCGACWAITARETVESAHYLSTGTLYDLSETEMIACDDSCEMCSGGWPQNAFEWVIDHGGLPLAADLGYSDSFLLALTESIQGTSYSYSENTIALYLQKICPAGGGGDSKSSGSNSGDQVEQNNDDANYEYVERARYGYIKGYGYATDRCICYSDGSGCDCDDQNEALAVANLASYGPAVVCLEASLWQDYNGGIITSSLGCSSKFLDMNHCVQAVGYAFVDVDSDDGGGSGSGSGSGSRDSGNREGYWIIRNQWGQNWGMNGYAYVAMGENTCGVLNDMTQAFL